MLGLVLTMKAVERINAKLSSCEAAWRGLPRLENMVLAASVQVGIVEL